MAERLPTRYERACGDDAFGRRTEAFHAPVRDDEVLAPVFAHSPDDHPRPAATARTRAEPPEQASLPRWGWGEAPPYTGS